MRMSKRHGIIIGGGIGGMATALGLIKLGFDVKVFEQAPALGEVGAGVTLIPSAMKAFEWLGIADRIRRRSVRVAAMPFMHYKTAKILTGAPDPDWFHSDDDEHYGGRHMHRADLHAVLTEAVLERAPHAVSLGHAFADLQEEDAQIRVSFANGETATGDFMIGADGVRSAVRTVMFGRENPRFRGQVAWRSLIPIETVRPYLGAGRAALFLGPERVFLRYGVKDATLVNCVAIAKSDAWTEEGWAIHSTREELRREYADWHPDVLGLIDKAPEDGLFKWALFDRVPLPHWAKGRAALLGDSAHAMLPFLGTGAAMAIEDAVVAARALDVFDDPAEALRRYEAARLPRATQMALDATRQGEINQRTDPDNYMLHAPPAQDKTLFEYDPTVAPL